MSIFFFALDGRLPGSDKRFSFLISVEQIFREANVSLNGQVKYEDFVKIACAPVPDYY